MLLKVKLLDRCLLIRLNSFQIKENIYIYICIDNDDDNDGESMDWQPLDWMKYETFEVTHSDS